MSEQGGGAGGGGGGAIAASESASLPPTPALSPTVAAPVHRAPPRSRSLVRRMGWTLRDYAKRVWDNSAEDNIFFLAGGIAFNILLAAVPFVLLLAAGLAAFLDQSADASSSTLIALVDQLMPPHEETAESPVHKLLNDVTKTRGAVGIWGAIGFIWFSTRLFGSLRSVLAEVFDIEQDRGIVDGKIFDIKITIIATMLVCAYTALNFYLAFATRRGVRALAQVGVEESTMGRVEYTIGWLIAFSVITMMFWSLYKFLPKRRVRSRAALLAALFASVMFEIAKNVFTSYVASFDPGSFYTGTLYAIVILVVWVYYSALIFILGGEIGQVYELRRVRRIQRETFVE